MFKWLKPRTDYVDLPSTKAPRAISEKEQNFFLHGYDLREWDYLGYSDIFYRYNNNPTDKYSANVFFFMLKNNDKVRHYVVRHHHHSSAFNFNIHEWVTTVADIWRANQTPWYDPVRTLPSKYLKDRMLLDHDSVWDQDKSWWIRATEQEQYNASMTKQRKPKKEKAKEIDENVVKVDFNAKNNEDA